MKPIKFKGVNASFTSPEGVITPAFKGNDKNGTFVVGYSFGFWERIYLLFWGKIWFSQITNNSKPKAFILTLNKNKVLAREKKS